MDDALTIGVTQTVAAGTSSATMTNPTSGARRILVTATVPAYIKISPAAAPVAATINDFYIAANYPYLINVGAGAVKVSAMRGGTVDGGVYVTEVS